MDKGITETDRFVFFWHGCLSQWHLAKINIEDAAYSCCEQYMMAEKARLFGDTQTLKKIMQTSSPKEQKALGRQVANFDEGKWAEVAEDVVYRANLAKFSQHKNLAETLAATGSKTIVEASPYDKIWGVGLGVEDHRIHDPATWQGKNLLGKALMKVRDTLAHR